MSVHLLICHQRWPDKKTLGTAKRPAHFVHSRRAAYTQRMQVTERAVVSRCVDARGVGFLRRLWPRPSSLTGAVAVSARRRHQIRADSPTRAQQATRSAAATNRIQYGPTGDVLLGRQLPAAPAQTSLAGRSHTDSRCADRNCADQNRWGALRDECCLVGGV